MWLPSSRLYNTGTFICTLPGLHMYSYVSSFVVLPVTVASTLVQDTAACLSRIYMPDTFICTLSGLHFCMLFLTHIFICNTAQQQLGLNVTAASTLVHHLALDSAVYTCQAPLYVTRVFSLPHTISVDCYHSRYAGTESGAGLSRAMPGTFVCTLPRNGAPH